MLPQEVEHNRDMKVAAEMQVEKETWAKEAKVAKPQKGT